MTIKNFKRIRDISVDLGKVTILIGPNGSGKSSILQALIMAKQSLENSRIQTKGDIMDLGSFNDIVSKSSRKKEFSLAFHFKDKVDFSNDWHDYHPKYPKLRNAEVDLAYETIAKDRDLLSRFKMRVGNLRIQGDNRGEIEPSTFGDESSQTFVNISSQNMEYGRLFQPTGGNAQNKKLYEAMHEAILFLGSIPKSLLSKVYLVPPVRGFTIPQYDLQPEFQNELLHAGGFDQQASGAASTLAYLRGQEQKISKWVKAVTGRGIEAKLFPKHKVSVYSLGDFDINSVNEGFGVNQLVQLFIPLATSSTGSVIGIEEPEIHLHPNAQSKLADLLIEIAINENKQIIICTHSERILSRVLSNVLKKLLLPKELRVYYISAEKGETEKEELKVDEKGRLKGGLKGFFESELKEYKQFLETVHA